MLGSRRGTLVLLPPGVRRRHALHGHHSRARAPDHPAQRRIGVEVYAGAPTGAPGVVGAVARSRHRVATRVRAEAMAARHEARAARSLGPRAPRTLGGLEGRVGFPGASRTLAALEGRVGSPARPERWPL